MRHGAHALARSTSLPLAFALALTCSMRARADVQHVVKKDEKLPAIAQKYDVSVKAILKANRLANGKQIEPGEVLTIPTGEGAKASDKKDAAKGKGETEHAKKDAKETSKDKDKKGEAGKKSEPASYASKPKTPGVVHVKRLATTEEADVRILDKKGKVQPTALKSFEKIMRSPSGAAHPIEPRLLALLTTVSNHFGSRKIEIVSGFRPFTPTQYTPHSNHNHGKAIDFRVVGVPNEAVRDFCRTLKNVGCGYYPNSTFVHMDVRESSAFWIDYSKPGEPPRYNAPNVEADEGTSDVHGDVHPSANTAPTPAPAEEPAPGTANESDPPPAMKPAETTD